MTQSSNIKLASSSRVPDPSSIGPTVSILVVTWNSADPLGRLLDSLSDSELLVELVQVDNASRDDSLGIAKRWSERTGRPIRQIRNEANVGFARGLKQAVELARGQFLLVVNPDIRLEPDALRALVAALDDPGLGAVGPRIVDQTGNVELTCARRSLGVFASVAHALGLRRLLAGTRVDPYTYPRASYDVEREVSCLSGAAMLIRAKALTSAGGVDDRWFMYFEDMDICERLRKVGWRLLYTPRAVARHESASSSPRNLRLEVWLAVHQEAAVNLFLASHRGRWAAHIHRFAVALGGLMRTATALPVAAKSSGIGQRRWRVGTGFLRWALTSGMPSGTPSSAAGPRF